MSKVRVGFVGAGNMGQTAHLQNFAVVPDCEVVALAEGRPETARLVAQRYGIPKVYPDHRSMLAEAELDAVVAIMDYRLHPSVMPDILRAGLPLMTEKPICLRLENGRKLLELAEARGVMFMVGNMKRSLPASVEALSRIREWKASGEAGQMNYVRASMPPGDWVFGIQWGINAGDSPSAYADEQPEDLPEWLPEDLAQKYNAFVNYFIHQVNLIRYLLGEDYRINYVDPHEAVAVGESASGVPVLLEMKGHGLNMSWEETYMVSFENGKVDLSLPAPMAQQNGGDVCFYLGSAEGRGPAWERPVMPPVWSMLAQAQHFVECVRDGKPTRSPASEAVKDLVNAEEYIRALARSLGRADDLRD